MAERLRERIHSGVWLPGQIIPSLEAIADEFGIARVTARQAMQLLAEEKLVLPRRGIGTVVASTVRAARSVNLESSLADLSAMYENTHTEILTFDESIRKAEIPPEAGKRGESYVHMRRVHFTEGAPYATISLHLLERVFRRNPSGFRSKAVIPLLVRMNVIERARQILSIGTADAETAHLLRVSTGSPVAHVRRTFHDKHDVVLYYAEVKYRGDWVRWEVDLKPDNPPSQGAGRSGKK
ncbi:MAG: GntR family transcriptional regulator [Pseudomonadota bacterium]